MNPLVSSYQNTIVTSVSSNKPETLMVMIFEGMINKVKQAEELHASGNLAAARASIVRAMKIADALQESLNFEEGGEAAKNLERLYDYILSELAIANRSDNPIIPLKHVICILEPLLSSFKQMQAQHA